ncbi:hotdog family protein [Pseudomonas monteilii]|uniref:hypothetical protein n=1 Tax=Pseudomonas monteilii TaxID=76759 RepID=UPI00383B7B42
MAEALRAAPVLEVSQLKSAVGQVFTSPWFQVDREHCAKFAESSFLDLVYTDPAVNERYQDGLVEGFYIVSLMDALRSCAYRDHPSHHGINYGSNRLRFIQPVTYSDVLRLECLIAEVSERANGELVEVECRLMAQGHERPSVVYSLMYLLLPAEKVLTVL